MNLVNARSLGSMGYLWAFCLSRKQMHRLNRIIRLLECLTSDQRWTIDSLSSELEIVRRSLFRDLRVLRRAGLTYHVDPKLRSIVVQRMPRIAALDLTIQEAAHLLLLLREVGKSKVNPYPDAALSAAHKIELALPEQLALMCQELLQDVELSFWPTSDAKRVSGLLTRLMKVAADRRKVEVTYESTSEVDEITTILHIYQLAFMRRSWYAIGYSELHKAIRTIKVERIQDVDVLDGRFVADPQFTLDEYLGSAWQMLRGVQQHYVVIRFARGVAHEVESVVWHPTQQTRWETSGALILEVDVDGLNEIAWWVLGFGGHALVLEPPELRDLIQEQIREMRRMYGS